MNQLILYTTAALMALVGVVCAVLCVAWSIPSWRQRIARPKATIGVLGSTNTSGLTGWLASIGNIVISVGIGACAVVALYGSYLILSTMIS